MTLRTAIQLELCFARTQFRGLPLDGGMNICPRCCRRAYQQRTCSDGSQRKLGAWFRAAKAWHTIVRAPQGYLSCAPRHCVQTAHFTTETTPDHFMHLSVGGTTAAHVHTCSGASSSRLIHDPSFNSCDSLIARAMPGGHCYRSSQSRCLEASRCAAWPCPGCHGRSWPLNPRHHNKAFLQLGRTQGCSYSI